MKKESIINSSLFKVATIKHLTPSTSMTRNALLDGSMEFKESCRACVDKGVRKTKNKKKLATKIRNGLSGLVRANWARLAVVSDLFSELKRCFQIFMSLRSVGCPRTRPTSRADSRPASCEPADSARPRGSPGRAHGAGPPALTRLRRPTARSARA